MGESQGGEPRGRAKRESQGGEPMGRANGESQGGEPRGGGGAKRESQGGEPRGKAKGEGQGEGQGGEPRGRSKGEGLGLAVGLACHYIFLLSAPEAARLVLHACSSWFRPAFGTMTPDMVIGSPLEIRNDPTLPLGWYLSKEVYLLVFKFLARENQVWELIWPACFDYEDEHNTKCAVCASR